MNLDNIPAPRTDAIVSYQDSLSLAARLERENTALRECADRLYRALETQAPLHLNQAEAKATTMEAYDELKALLNGSMPQGS